jgi:pyruvate dehydrogenase E2 component (dihydrolipoamide acetyltransferase)
MNYEFKFPDVGEGIHEGKVLQWKAQVNDNVKMGDILAIVETDKVVAEIPSPKDGKLIKQNVAEGQIIHVGEVLAVIEIMGEDKQTETVEEAATVIGQLETAKGMVLPSSGEGLYDKSPESVSLSDKKDIVLATPVARKMAKDMGVDITKVKGTGPAARVMKIDIETAARQINKMETKTDKSEPPVISPPPIILPGNENADYKSSFLSTIRNTIAINMEVSQAIPTATLSDYIEIDELVQLRKRLNEKEGHFTFTPILIKLIAAAVKQYPIINSHYDPAKKEIKTFNAINIGFAVDTEAGLMAPVIKNVEKKSIIEINEEVRSLSEKAVKRIISLDDLRGGTISVTNYGSFGGVFGSPKIIPPQTAIVGIGRIHKTPYVKNDEVIAANILPVSLVFDHRVIDGALAGKFISYFLKLANSPEKMLISI